METVEQIISRTGQPVVEIRVEPDPYLSGWSSVRLYDISGLPDGDELFTWEEYDQLSKLFTSCAELADAHLANNIFPRPTADGMVVDPIPDVLAVRFLPQLAAALAQIFQDRPGPVPDRWVSIHQALDAVEADLQRYGEVPADSSQADTLRAAAASLLAAIELPPIPTDDDGD